MMEPATAEDRRAAVAAARLQHFNVAGRMTPPAVPPQDEEMDEELEEGLAHGAAFNMELQEVRDSVRRLEEQVTTVTGLLAALHDAVDSIKTHLQNLPHCTGHQTVPGVQENLVHDQEVEVVAVDEGNPSQDLFDDEPATAKVKEAEEEQEDLEYSCGVCHVHCKKLIKVLIPCGHYPFCPKCVEKMQSKRDNMSLFSRPNGWDQAELFCPICTRACGSTQTLRQLDPYRDNIALI